MYNILIIDIFSSWEFCWHHQVNSSCLVDDDAVVAGRVDRNDHFAAVAANVPGLYRHRPKQEE